MALTVKSSINGNETTLEKISNNLYQASTIAPQAEIQSNQVYSVTIIAEDDAGNSTVNNSEVLQVQNNKEFDFISADQNGNEKGYADDLLTIDVEIINPLLVSSDTAKTFEAVVNANAWNKDSYGYDYRLYIPDTEYGGIIKDIEVVTSEDAIYVRGFTWRGLLGNQVVRPPDGQSNLVLEGDVNEAIRQLITDRFKGLFYVPEESAGVNLHNWVVDRYTTVEKAIQKIVDENQLKIRMKYMQEHKAVEIRAVPAVDYSEEIEFSQDARLNFDIRDDRTGVNHLICGGKGEGAERQIIDLYVQVDGTIGDIQYYFGLDEVEQFFDYANAQSEEELRIAGIERLKELQSKKTFGIFIENMDLEIGDIVGGREYITDTNLQAPVVQKILRKQEGTISIEYNLKGDS